MKNQAVNPYLPNFEYIPDGEAHVFEKRLYVYGSHDRFNGHLFCLNNYVLWSADPMELTEWQYEGEIYDKRKDPMCDENDHFLYAPDVTVGTDGRYYLYYSLDFSGIIAVAVADTPIGPFEYYGNVQYSDGTLLGKKEGDSFQYDPAVLVEEGRVFLYSGFCPDSYFWKSLSMPVPYTNGGVVVELEADMITVNGTAKCIIPSSKNSKGTGFENHEFFEAPSIRKINNKYYLIYASIHGHELCYAVSDAPDGAFTYGGTIISNGDVFLNRRAEQEALNYIGNNHGSIEEINGHWYIFYHRHTNRNQFSRQGCAEKIEILKDGTIPQVEMTSCGLNQGPLSGTGEYDAAIACNLMSREGAGKYEFGNTLAPFHPYFTQEGRDRENDPNQYIANITDGTLIGYKYFIFSNETEISLTYRGTAEGVLYVGSKERANDIAVIQVTSNTNWTKIVTAMKVPKGKSALYFYYCGSGSLDLVNFAMN